MCRVVHFYEYAHVMKIVWVSSERERIINIVEWRTSRRHLYTKIIIPSGHTSLSPTLYKVLMNLETYISKQVTRLRQCKRIHKRSRRRPEYPRTNNNRLRGVHLYLQTIPRGRNTSCWTMRTIRNYCFDNFARNASVNLFAKLKFA